MHHTNPVEQLYSPIGCKKGEANQKQQLSDYEYITILATKSFDIELKLRIS